MTQRRRSAFSRLWAVLAVSALLAASSLNAAAFRFAWLSDTHVGSLTGEEDLRATVREINSITGLSFVVLSGDVTEYGSKEQLQLAREILDGLKLPCHVIPGNHDTKWSESGATDFPRIWKNDRFVFEHEGYTFIGLHQGPLMKMGDGHWSPQDVRWLRQTLERMPDKNRPLIFITHYPIDDGIANWFVVLDLLKRYNIQLILSGHVHRNGSTSFEGVPGITGRANLRGAAPAGGFTIVSVDSGDPGQAAVAEHVVGRGTDAPWHSVTLQKRDYSQDTNTYPRPDFSVNAKYPKVISQWDFDSGYTIASTPAIWHDLAIVGDASGSVYALAVSSGKKAWSFKTGGPVYSTPETAGDSVIFASTDGSVYCLKAADGQLRWRFRTGRPIVASPAAAEGKVFIGSSEGKFRGLEVASGKLVWEFNGLGGFVEAKPRIYEGKVIFGAWDQNLYALQANTGKLAWKWQGDKPGILFSPAACWPAAAKGKVFVVAPDRKLTAIDAGSGEQIWRTGAYAVRESIGVSRDQERIYVRAIQDFIYAFSTAASGPQKLWETEAGFGYDINSATLFEREGTLFYGTKNGIVMALDGKSGALKWQHRIGFGLVNTVLPLSATQVLTTDCDGRIALISASR